MAQQDSFLKHVSRTDIRDMAAFFIILLSFIFVFMLATIPVPEGNQRLVDILGTAIISIMVGGAIGYLFSTSKKQKTPEEIIAERRQSVNSSIQTTQQTTTTAVVEEVVEENAEELEGR